MKKITFLITIMLAVFSSNYGQVSSYSFTQTAGTYTPIAGGTTVASITTITGTAPTSAERMDDIIYNLPDGTIPFSFVFDGVGYTGLNISSNGFITFGTTAPSTTNYTPISSTATYLGVISAFSRDLEGGYHITADRTSGSSDLLNASSIGPISVGDFVYGTGIPAGVTVTAINGSTITLSATATSTATAGAVRFGAPWSNIQYVTEGVAPNRTFVIQFSNFKRFGTTSGTSKDMILNFQFRLNENNNTINIVYGNCSPGTTTLTTVSEVGLRGATNAFATNVNNRRNTKGTNDDWVNSVVGTANTSGMLFNATAPANVISSGLTYTWTPPAGCTGVPVAGSVSPAIQNICTGSTPSNLVATGYSSGVTGITFQWEESNDDGVGDAWANTVGGSGATTGTYTPPAFTGTPIYYRLRVTCSNSAQSVYTSSVLVTVPSSPSTQASVMTTGSATLTSLPFSWTNGNGNRRVVIFNTSNSFTDPINGNGPALTAATAYSGSGEQIVYDGTGTTVTVTGLTSGSTYYAKVYEYVRCGSGPYDFYFNVSTGTNVASGTTLTPPTNDNFVNAQPIVCGNTYSGSTAVATLDEDSAPDGFGADMDAPNVWYSFTGSGTPQTVTLELCGSSYDTSVLVYTGSSGALTLVAGNDDAGTTACPGAGTRSKLNFNSDGTTTYYIAIEGWNSTNTGNYIMNVTCAIINPPAVPNQTCASALAVNVDGSTTNSDNSYGDVSSAQPSCDLFGAIQDVWFSFVAPASGTVECVVTNGTMTSGNFNVYTGADCSSLTAVTNTCNSDFTTSSTEALTGLVAGTTYYVQVWSGSAEQGTFTLKLTDTSLANDSFDFTSFRAYPNPVKDVLNLSYSSEISSVEVFNLIGQKLLVKNLNATQGEVNFSNLNSGNYIIRVTSGDQVQTIKIVKN